LSCMERQRGTSYSHFNVYEVDVQFYLGIFKKRQIFPNFNVFRATESTWWARYCETRLSIVTLISYIQILYVIIKWMQKWRVKFIHFCAQFLIYCTAPVLGRLYQLLVTMISNRLRNQLLDKYVDIARISC
jgi:hypothetical protein